MQIPQSSSKIYGSSRIFAEISECRGKPLCLPFCEQGNHRGLPYKNPQKSLKNQIYKNEVKYDNYRK